MKRFAKASHERLTILTGPPATGKTFVALQLLWQAYAQGRSVSWLGPERPAATTGPIAVEEEKWTSFPSFRDRVERLNRRLGLDPDRPPLDVVDFAARFLEPGALVYLEDPFGKTDSEYGHSLHTCDFFDLERFLQFLEQHSRRADCRLLLTSRENLFARWQSERQDRGDQLPTCRILAIGTSPYSRDGLFGHVLPLAQARQAAEPHDIARTIAELVSTPFEAELVARELQQGATATQASRVAESWKHDLGDNISRLLTAESDSDLLLLLLGAGLDSPSLAADLVPTYLGLHQELRLNGDSASELLSGLSRFASCLSWSGSLTEKPELPQRMSINHSLIRERIEALFKQAKNHEFLARAALALSTLLPLPREEVESGPFLVKMLAGDPWSAHKPLSQLLLRLGVSQANETADDALTTLILDRLRLDWGNTPGVVKAWPRLSESMKERFFAKLAAATNSMLLQSALAHLTYSQVSPEEAWRFYSVLFASRKPLPIYGLHGDMHWYYLLLHLSEAPEEILQALDNLVVSKPKDFLQALGKLLVYRWDLAGISRARVLRWRGLFFSGDLLQDDEVQFGLASEIARTWDVAPQALLELFDSQLRSRNPEVRATYAGRAAFWADENPELAAFATETAADPELDVLAAAFDASREPFLRQELGLALLGRVDPRAPLRLLGILLKKNEPWNDLDRGLAETARSRGGEPAEALLVYQFLKPDKHARELDRQSSPPEESDSEPVRLAWIWAYLNGLGKSRALAEPRVKELLLGLREERPRGLGLFYLSLRWHTLSPAMRQLVEELHGGSEGDLQALEEGAKYRGSAKHSPTLDLLVEELVESAGDSTDKHRALT